MINKILKSIFIPAIVLLLAPFNFSSAENITERLLGRIVLRVEQSGEAWYIEPQSREALYLGRPSDAFAVMKSYGLGISEKDFNSFSRYAPQKFSGRILLQVEQSGEAWYVNPSDLKMHFLGRPHDAFVVMKNLGLGISDEDLQLIKNKKFVEPEMIDAQFTSQAPFGEWDDERQQEGCEEASSFMAVKWGRRENFDRNEALREIIAASEFQKKNYGGYIDTSAEDTLDRIIKNYFGYQKAGLKNNVSKEDIIAEIKKGNLIIAPTAGKKLGNPYFTPPGPLIHMLLIKGYDAASDEFITNDPGTRRGESFRYDEDVLFAAISDYKTSGGELTGEKNIIIVWR